MRAKLSLKLIAVVECSKIFDDAGLACDAIVERLCWAGKERIFIDAKSGRRVIDQVGTIIWWFIGNADNRSTLHHLRLLEMAPMLRLATVLAFALHRLAVVAALAATTSPANAACTLFAMRMLMIVTCNTPSW
ncbi:MAG: hypothetical protein EOO77_42655 [Oxalobacteraceae bacterium]|nr:MAG: hypothetical protein EOO77_42655 [Oxalobacteraceae bacterium]